MTTSRIPVVLAALALAASLLAGPLPAAFAAEGGASLVAEARGRLRKRDLRGALAAVEKAIAADPSDADAHLLYQDLARNVVGAEGLRTLYRQKSAEKPDDPMLATLHARCMPAEEALKEFDKQIAKFPASAWPHAGKARILENLGRAQEAAAQYDAAVLAAPNDLRFKAYQAYGFERAGNAQAAADAWKMVLAGKPGDRAARIGLGEAQRRLGVFDEALATFAEIVKSDPADAEAHFRIGLVHLDAKRLDDSIKSFDAALAQDRAFVDAYAAAAEVAIRKALETAAKEKRDPVEKDFDAAIQYANKAAAAGSDRADAHFVFAAAHEAAGGSAASHYDTAAVEYDAALGLLPLPGPEKVRTLCAKAFVLLMLQKWDLAVATADKAIGIDEKCIAAYAHAGHALCAQGRQDEAIKKYYRVGLKFAPEDARLRHALGVALWETAHEQDAKKELEAAVKAEPTSVRYRHTLGELYYHLKMYRQAGEQIAKIVDLVPDNVEVWRSYGRICCALKQWDQAIEAYEKICELLEAPEPANASGGPEPGAGAAPANADDELLIQAHLYLMLIYSDHVKKRDKAKEHAKKFVQLGGDDPNLQSLLDDLLADK